MGNEQVVGQFLIAAASPDDHYNCYLPFDPFTHFNQQVVCPMMSRLRRVLPPAVGAIALICCCPNANAQNEAERPGRPPGPGPEVQAETVITAHGETLQEAWSSALTVDPELEASRWQSSAAQRGLYAARAERLPSVSAGASYFVFDNPLTINAPIPGGPPITASVTVNQREFFVGSVRARQPLCTFGRIRSAIDAAGAEVTAAVADEERTGLDVKLQVATAYVGVLQAQRLLEVAHSGVTSLEAHERDVQNRLDQGIGIKANLLAVQVALANARQFRVQMHNGLTVAQAAYNRTLQRPLETAVQIQDLSRPTQEYELEMAIQQAFGLRPEIGFLSAKVRALRSLAHSTRAGKLPQFMLSGGFGFTENRFLDNEAFNNVAVLGEWNFWDSGRKRNRSAQLEQSAEALLRKRSNVESLIALQVKQAWHNLDSAQEQVNVNQQALNSADENLRVSRNRYQEGAGTNTEVLDAQTLRTQAYSNYYRSLYDSVLAEMQLLRAIGTL
jgi:outer membrane protein TolC